MIIVSENAFYGGRTFSLIFPVFLSKSSVFITCKKKYRGDNDIIVADNYVKSLSIG